MQALADIYIHSPVWIKAVWAFTPLLLLLVLILALLLLILENRVRRYQQVPAMPHEFPVPPHASLPMEDRGLEGEADPLRLSGPELDAPHFPGDRGD